MTQTPDDQYRRTEDNGIRCYAAERTAVSPLSGSITIQLSTDSSMIDQNPNADPWVELLLSAGSGGGLYAALGIADARWLAVRLTEAADLAEGR